MTNDTGKLIRLSPEAYADAEPWESDHLTRRPVNGKIQWSGRCGSCLSVYAY